MADTYTPVAGDTWDMIAYRALGSCAYVHLLIAANREHVDAAIFSAGIVLKLPIIKERAAHLPPWRRP